MSKKMTYDEFLSKAILKHGGKFSYDKVDKNTFNGSHSIITVTCPKHGDFSIMAKNHLLYDCNKCSYEKRALNFRSNTKEFINKARKVHGDKYDYSKVEYITAKKDKVCIICPKHGEFWMLPNDHLNGKGCLLCSESHLEREVRLSLEKYGIDYEKNKHFKWLNKMEIDFYLPKHNIGIECQGKQHFGLGGWSKRYDFEKTFESDKMKNNLCNENNVIIYYLLDKENINLLENFEIYNETNSFTDINILIETILCQEKR